MNEKGDIYPNSGGRALETNFKKSDSVYEEMKRSSQCAEEIGEVVVISACKAD